MNAPPANIISVHPERMLTVTLQYPGQAVQVNAIACRYIPAIVFIADVAQRVIAIEVIRDPMNPVPIQPYPCYANLLEIIRLPANALLHVRPYLPFPEPVVAAPAGPPHGQFG
ncbi:MAG: hypothetical protein ACREJ3_15445 [Polyangiaceae bacterium]